MSALLLTYDRGTVIVTGDRRGAPPVVSAPHLVWDDRVDRPRGAAADWERIAAELTGRGYEVEARVLAPSASTVTGPWDIPPLRPYQDAALAAWLAAGRRGVIALPTGAGKTLVALAALAATRVPALCLVPTRVLLGQWVKALHQVYQAPIGVFGDGAQRLEPVTIATFESAARHMPALGNRFPLLVVDEVHHFAGPAGRPSGVSADTGTSRAEALLMSAAPWRLGLTATLPDEPRQIERLAARVGPPVFALAVRDLAGGYLAPFDVLTFTLRFTPDEAGAYAADRALYRAVAGPFFREREAVDARAPGLADVGRAARAASRTRRADWAAFCRYASETVQGRAALDAWRRMRALIDFHASKADVIGALLSAHRDARTLIFTGSNAAAYAVAVGQLVQPITCDIGRAERAEALEAFSRGTLRALVSSHVLDEGVDVPSADVAIVAGGGAGAREYVQRIGRLLRPAEGKRALVYHLVTRGTLEVPRAGRLQGALEGAVTGSQGSPEGRLEEMLDGSAGPSAQADMKA